MGLATYTYNRSTSGGEIIRELVNASDGQGLHFDGAAGCIDIESPPDLGTKFSFEFIVQQDENADNYLVDFDGALTSRFIIGRVSGNLSVYSSTTSFWVSFGVAPLDDNEVHHLVVTVDGTSAIAYDNGNQIASKTISSAHLIDSATDAKIGASYDASSDFFNGTIYRARFWNKALTAAEVTASYQNATVSFADQYGVEPAQNVSTCVQDASDPYTSFTSVSATGFTAIQTGAVASIAGTADEIALVLGKNYRVSFYIANTSQAPRVSFAESLTGSVLQELVGLGVMTTGTQTFDVTYTGATATGVLKFDNTAAASYAMTLLSITRVGCVADYDLAFANPSPSPNGQSLMVRDRASAADGTSSATGVTQVTPIVQVNATAARIGTTAATPADGDLAVSGNVGVGRPPTTDLDLYKSGQDVELKIEAATSTANAYYTMRNDDAKQLHMRLGGSAVGGTTWAGLTGSNQASIEAQSCSSFTIGTHVAAPIVFVQARAAKMTIASDGLVTAANGIVETNGVLKENLLTNSGFDVWSNSTLESAADLVTNGDFSGANRDTDWETGTGWEIEDQGGGDYEAVATNNEAWIYQTKGVTPGKLYRVTITCSNYTDGSVAAFMYGGAPVIARYGNTLTGTGTSTLVWEAENATIFIGAATRTAGSNVRVDDITFDEVTPGCVAADALGPDTMTKSVNLDIWRQHNDGGTYTKDGSYYSLKATNTAATQYLYLKPNVTLAEELQRFASRNVTLGAWVKTDTASHARLRIYNGDTSTYSSYHTGGNAWEWLELTATMDASPDSVMLAVHLATDTKTAYISQPTACWGSAIGEGGYSRPSGEIVWFERTLGINLTDFDGGTVSSDTAINLESQSSGRIPKGAKAVHFTVYGKCATAEKWISISKSTSDYGSFIYSQVASKTFGWGDFVSCDSDGDIAVRRNDTFTDVTMKVDAVALR